MTPEQFRNLISLFEARSTDHTYVDKSDEVIVTLRAHHSQVYTKLAQKVQRISELEDEISKLKDEVKQSTREDIADLFDAEDAAKKRVVDTVSFILELSKDPRPTVAPKYKDILTELSTKLTPELILVLEQLKQSMVTVSQKSAGLKITAKPTVKEGRFSGLFNRLKNVIFQWGARYDHELANLKQIAAQR